MRKAVSFLSTCLFVAALSPTPVFAQSPGGDGPEPPPEPVSSPAPAPAAANPAPAGNPGAMNVATDGAGSKARGFVFEVGLDGRMPVYGGTEYATLKVGGTVMLGYKLNRLIFGLGLQYHHLAYYDKEKRVLGGTTVETKYHYKLHGMLFQPTVQFHLVESNPLALYLSSGVHLGFAVFNETGTDRDDDTSIALVGFHVGVGMRFFLHPRFAIGLEAGYSGLWVISRYNQDGEGDYVNTETFEGGGIYGRLGFAAIW